MSIRLTGCLWHGCPTCYPDRAVKAPRTNQSLDELYALTLIKKKVLTEELRYDYVCIWEHDWLTRMRDDPDVREFVASLDLHERLDPRDSFFGGRTNAAKLFYKATEGVHARYVDFTRLVSSSLTYRACYLRVCPPRRSRLSLFVTVISVCTHS